VLFVPAKHFELLPAGLRVEVEEQADRFVLTVSAEAFAKFVELELKSADGIFSDNYFDLSAGMPKQVILKKESLSGVLSLDAFKAGLRVRSLVDSYE
jgi:beta-mannosidase